MFRLICCPSGVLSRHLVDRRTRAVCTATFDDVSIATHQAWRTRISDSDQWQTISPRDDGDNCQDQRASKC